MNPIPRTLLALAILITLWALVSHMAFSPVERDALPGNYRLDTPFFLQKKEKPSRVEFDAGGEIRIYTAEGAAPLRAKWWWDEAEGFMRSDAPELDRRIHAYRGWSGVNLYWRLDEDFYYGEEVALEHLDR